MSLSNAITRGLLRRWRPSAATGLTRGKSASHITTKPWKGAHSDVAELVPTEWAGRFREFDRSVIPPGHSAPTERYRNIHDSLSQGPMREPLTLEVATESQTALMVDGNHRLSAALSLGRSDVPVRVETVARHFDEESVTKAVDVSDILQVREAGRTLKPSAAFRAGAPPTPDQSLNAAPRHSSARSGLPSRSRRY